MMLHRVLNNLSKPHHIPSKIINKLNRKWVNCILNKRHSVVLDGKPIFTMRNFGEITKMRINTFATKEPETLKWIDSFNKGDVLLDIGANVGIYSLYAAYRGHPVAALEPDALNFALLNLNIQDNEFNNRIMAYPYSVHENSKLSSLNIHRYLWGGTASSFDRSLDWKGNEMIPVFKQGSPGISIDDFVENSLSFPNHIKIDVDGNEYLILAGASNTLNNPNCKSVLIELFEEHPEYQRCIEFLYHHGFILSEKAHSPMFDSDPLKTENYIFIKSK